MRKVIIIALAVLIGMPVIAGSYYWTRRTTILAAKIEEALRVPVSIGEIEVHSDQIIIKQLRIKNFADSVVEDAFFVESIAVNFKISDLLSSPTQIQSIQIQEPMIGVEMYNPTGSKNNWQRLLKHSSSTSKASIPSKTPSSGIEEPKKRSHEFFVKKVTLGKTRVRAYNSSLRDDVIEPKPIQLIELHNLSSEEPINLKELISAITRAIMKEILSLPGLAHILDDLAKDLPKKAIKDVINPLKKINGNSLEKEVKKIFKKL